MRSALRLVACFSCLAFCFSGLISVAGCESLWGGFRDPFPGNCVTNPGICTGGLVCNTATRLCQTPDAGGGSDGGGSDGGGPCSFPSVGCSADGYCQQQVPSSEDLYGIGGFSADNVWAVGNNGTILSWNGQSWQNQQPVVNPLYGMWGSGPNNLWIVGNVGMLLKWNGSSWVQQTAITSSALRAVWGISPTSVRAVGDSDASFRWDGSGWSSDSFSSSRQLKGIWYRDESNVFVAADAGYIFRYAASAWTPDQPDSKILRAVWGAANNDVWAVGGSAKSGVIYHFDGSAWAMQLATGVQLNAVTGCDANNVWAVGTSGTILKWQGSSWEQPDSGVVARDFVGAYAVQTSCGCSVFIVGTGGLVLRK